MNQPRTDPAHDTARHGDTNMENPNQPVSPQITNVRDLMPILYDELRQLAEKYISPAGQGHYTLQPTAIVHEVFLRMSHYSPDQLFETKRHFYAAAAESMRQFLIEYHRRKNAEKRGGSMTRVFIPLQTMPDQKPQTINVVELDEALTLLNQTDPEKAELVKLRFFCGLTIAEAAETLGISTATADRWWAFSKAFLAMKMEI